MKEEQIIAALARNPQGIRNIPNPTEAMKLAAVSHKGTLLEYMKDPSQAIIDAALANDIKAIAFVNNPSEDLQMEAVRQSWDNLRYIKAPTDAVVRAALAQSGWAIQYVENPSEALQLEAIGQNYDALQYIQEPSAAVCLAALQENYLALRYIEHPTAEMEAVALRQDIQAARLLTGITKERALRLLAVSSRVLGYLSDDLGLTAEDVLGVWKEKLSAQDVDRVYIQELAEDGRKRVIYGQTIDLAQVAYQYGALEAKKICMTVWLA